MRDFGRDSVGQQIINGVIVAFSIPFLLIYGIYKLTVWFVTALVHETGRRIVQFFGIVLAIIVVVFLLRLIGIELSPTSLQFFK